MNVAEWMQLIDDPLQPGPYIAALHAAARREIALEAEKRSRLPDPQSVIVIVPKKYAHRLPAPFH